MQESPGHLRLGRILEHIAPLNLTDPQSPSFSPDGCKTFHDIIRFAHEKGIKAMFGYAEVAEKLPGSVKLTGSTPLTIHLIDLGGGFREGLTTCDVVNADSVTSIPFRAVWEGFIHPGITWAGTLDTLCSDNFDHNYVTLQFSGGAGPLYSRVLRVQFLGIVLQKLGFEIALTGDFLEASLSRHDRSSTEEKLDQMGRLLACSHMLAIAKESWIECGRAEVK